MLTLIADPDREYAETISIILRREDHKTSIVSSRDEVSEFLSMALADLVVLSSAVAAGDREFIEPLPGTVSRLRREHHVPVIVLVERVSPNEIATLFDAGASDCVRKPFHPAEFAARARAVVRQARGYWTPANEGILAAPADDGLVIDEKGRRAYLRGIDLRLSDLEYQIVCALKRGNGKVLTYQELNEQVWDYTNLNDGTLLRGHVSAIRKKVAAAGIRRRLIRTVYGVGYALHQ